MKTKVICTLLIMVIALFGCQKSDILRIYEETTQGIYSKENHQYLTSYSKNSDQDMVSLCLGAYALKDGKIDGLEGSENLFTNALKYASAKSQKLYNRNIVEWHKIEILETLQNGFAVNERLLELGKKYAFASGKSGGYASELATEAFELGKAMLDSGELDFAKLYFDFVSLADHKQKPAIAELFLASYNLLTEDKAKAIEYAIQFDSQSTSITNTYSDYYYKLSQKATSTQEKHDYLVKACKYGKKYRTELNSVKSKLFEKKLLAKVKAQEKKWGPAKYLLVNWNSWKTVTQILKTERIYFFTPGYVDFKAEGKNKRVMGGRPTPNEIGKMRFTAFSKTGIQLKMSKKPTKIWFWTDSMIRS